MSPACHSLSGWERSGGSGRGRCRVASRPFVLSLPPTTDRDDPERLGARGQPTARVCFESNSSLTLQAPKICRAREGNGPRIHAFRSEGAELRAVDRRAFRFFGVRLERWRPNGTFLAGPGAGRSSAAGWEGFVRKLVAVVAAVSTIAGVFLAIAPTICATARTWSRPCWQSSQPTKVGA